MEVMFVATIVAVCAALAALILAYRFSEGFRFWFFDIWADLPVIGMISRRLARMSRPTTDEANRRLNELFRAYHLHIKEPIAEAKFDNIRKYLFLAGDAESRPTPMVAWLFLLVLLSAEAFTFSFLLGLSVSPNISENLAEMIAIGSAFLIALVLTLLSHPAGHSIRRTKELGAALRESIDDSGEWPAGEKPLADLTRRVALEDNQDCDKPNLANYDSQRLLNRMRRTATDRGSYILPVLFIIAIVIIGVMQFQLRYASQLISNATLQMAGDQSAFDQAIPVWANSFFVLMFFLTQGLALLLGFRYGFLGNESARAYHMIGGRKAHSEYVEEYENKVRRADESLTSLLAKFDARYPNVKPDSALYLERLRRFNESGGGGSGAPLDDNGAIAGGSNVTTLAAKKTGQSQ
jgi:hypothetical protein